MTSTKVAAAVRPATKPALGKTFIVFGADEYARPRAAIFWHADPAVLAKAVEGLALRMCEVTTAELKRLAKLLPAGKIEAVGPGFVHSVSGEIYHDIVVETAGDQKPAPASSAATKSLPSAWDDIVPGHLVLAHELLELGWWEAIVIERKGDLLTLRYRDFAGYPKFARHRAAVALISPPSK